MVKTNPTPAIELSQKVTPKGQEVVVTFLSEQLRQGLLKVGDRLLPERELAVRLDISRPVLREALRSLAMIGVLEIQQGRGTFVRSPDFSALSSLFTFMFLQNGDEIDDIIELRQAIERQAIGLACVRARSHDLEKLAAALETIRVTVDDPVAGGRADFEFHARLVDASHSSALIKIYAVVSGILAENHVARRHRIAATDQLREYLIDHHAQLFRAIQSRDIAESERLLSLHFAIGEKLSTQSIGRIVGDAA